MHVFQLIHDGVRVCRLFVNCKATNEQIAESLLVAAISFKLAGKYEELDGERYCGMHEYERVAKSGALVKVEGGRERGITDS